MTDLKDQKAEEVREEEASEGRPEATEQKGPSRSGGGARKVLRYATLPLILVAVCVANYLWVGTLSLDSIEERTINADTILTLMRQHLVISAITTVVVVALAVPTGVLLTRPALKAATPIIVAVAGIGQAIPSIGLLVIFAILLGFGTFWAIVALVIYTLLPVLRNTMVGIQQVDSSVIEAGRGMGMTKTAVLFKIELPLAIPIMLAGIRTALILAVGTATLATFINAGGMGDMIDTGLSLSRDSILITGALLTAVLALGIDYIAGIAEDILKPKGL
ncbi:ABC transporter permease [Rubrobacter aplysinae]|uniref:ABC transporter permease n=1 Tax=Rubrobacter aplysinae TaxID=909625 RepID=UPI00064C3DD4|nr:ABC transporter permease [Rubrobacter aplysinae]